MYLKSDHSTSQRLKRFAVLPFRHPCRIVVTQNVTVLKPISVQHFALRVGHLHFCPSRRRLCIHLNFTAAPIEWARSYYTDPAIALQVYEPVAPQLIADDVAIVWRAVTVLMATCARVEAQ